MADFSDSLFYQTLEGLVNAYTGNSPTALTVDGWNILSEAYYSDLGNISGSINLLLDGYARDSTESEHYRQLSNAMKAVTDVIDGYVVQQTFQENKNAIGAALQSILQSLDGYVTGTSSTFVLETTFQENKNAQQQINQSILVTLDGYALATDLTGLNSTVTENLNSQAQINQSVLQALDAYGAGGTEQEHYHQQAEINSQVLLALDGYAQNSTVTENKNAQQQINQSILQALDGYALSVEVSVTETTFQENKNAQEQINQTILQALDGYALLSIENQRWIDSSQQLQDIRTAIDGYGVTESEHYTQQGQINQSILQALDAYGQGFTESEHYHQQAEINSQILLALDGYAQNLTVTENKNAQYQVNQTILQALDGYALLSIENQRWVDSSQQLQDIRDAIDGYQQQEAKTAQEEINQSILQALDGYALVVDLNGINLTVTENKNAQQQINQSVLFALDGYGTVFDGYVFENLIPYYDDALKLGDGNRWHSVTAGSDGFHLVSRGSVFDAYGEINTVVGLLGAESALGGQSGYFTVAKPAKRSFIWPVHNLVVSKTNELYFSLPKSSSGSEASNAGTYQQVLKVNKDGLIQRITSGVTYDDQSLSVYELRDLIFSTSPHISQIGGIKVLGCDNNNVIYFASNAADDFDFADQLFPTFIGKINSDGTTTLVAGTGLATPLSGDGGQAIDANIWVDYKAGLRFDTSNNLYFSENLDAPNEGFDGCRIRKINASTGVITTVYTEAGASDSIIFDVANDGTIYASYGEVSQSQRSAIYTVPGLTRIASATDYNIIDIDSIRIDPGQQKLYFTAQRSGIVDMIGTVNLQTKEVGELIKHSKLDNHGGSTGDGKTIDSSTRINTLGYMDIDKFGNIYFPDFDFAIRKISFQYDEKVNTYDFTWRIDENDGYNAKLTSTVNGYQQDLIYASPDFDGYIGIGCIGNERLTVKGAISLENIGVAPVAIDGYGKIYSFSGDKHLYFVNSLGETSRLDEGLIGTVQEHHNQFSQAIQTIRKDLDGYNQTITEHYHQQSAINQAILQNLDGYAQNWSDASEQLQGLRDASDGYGITINEHYTQQGQINQSVRQALDGYALLSATTLTHNGTDGYVNTSSGDLYLNPAAGNVVPGSILVGLGAEDNPWADGYFRDLNTQGMVKGIISITSTDSPYLARQNDCTILADTSAGDITIVLPAAGGANKGRVYSIKKTDNTALSTVTIVPSGTEQIDGAGSLPITVQFFSRILQSDGLNWYVLGGLL